MRYNSILRIARSHRLGVVGDGESTQSFWIFRKKKKEKKKRKKSLNCSGNIIAVFCINSIYSAPFDDEPSLHVQMRKKHSFYFTTQRLSLIVMTYKQSAETMAEVRKKIVVKWTFTNYSTFFFTILMEMSSVLAASVMTRSKAKGGLCEWSEMRCRQRDWGWNGLKNCLAVSFFSSCSCFHTMTTLSCRLSLMPVRIVNLYLVETH